MIHQIYLSDMIDKSTFEAAKEIIARYEKEQVILSRQKNQGVCSKCGTNLSNRWEQNMCTANIDLKVSAQSTRTLFGDDENLGFEHPAIKEGSDYQRLILQVKNEGGYRLCLRCYDKFVRVIGDFIKTTDANG